jgi:hypothetical protein
MKREMELKQEQQQQQGGAGGDAATEPEVAE